MVSPWFPLQKLMTDLVKLLKTEWKEKQCAVLNTGLKTTKKRFNLFRKYMVNFSSIIKSKTVTKHNC